MQGFVNRAAEERNAIERDASAADQERGVARLSGGAMQG
jgi:hypothetical protein